MEWTDCYRGEIYSHSTATVRITPRGGSKKITFRVTCDRMSGNIIAQHISALHAAAREAIEARHLQSIERTNSDGTTSLTD